MAVSMGSEGLAQRVWRTEEQAFVAGARWRPLSDAEVVVHPALPEVWDASFVSHVAADADAERLSREAQAALTRAGCGHVKIILSDPALFGRLGSALRRLGLGERAFVTMVCRRVPLLDRPDPRIEIRAVADAPTRAAMAEVRDDVRREAPWYAPEVSRALDLWEDLQARTLDLTWLVAYYDEVPVGAVGLLLTSEGASLQSLATRPAYRRRGVASHLVQEVVRRGLAEGRAWVSLLTDRDDRPRRLYARLGFDVVGEVREYLKAIS
ncbi:MAG: GNAT family N-acetyltransferase [Deltaproteobacteria bacterium]|nr:MAG: GNAT family N-acetyltransferase [Deltaproteobacteria bacterium]